MGTAPGKLPRITAITKTKITATIIEIVITGMTIDDPNTVRPAIEHNRMAATTRIPIGGGAMNIVTMGTGILIKPGKDIAEVTWIGSTGGDTIVKTAIFSLASATREAVPALSFQSEDKSKAFSKYFYPLRTISSDGFNSSFPWCPRAVFSQCKGV